MDGWNVTPEGQEMSSDKLVLSRTTSLTEIGDRTEAKVCDLRVFVECKARESEKASSNKLVPFGITFLIEIGGRR